MAQERFHVNNDGNALPCGAKISCPYGNIKTDHFDTPSEARKAYEAGNLDHVFATLSKTLDEVVYGEDMETDREPMVIKVDMDGVLNGYGPGGKDHTDWVRPEGGESVTEVAERLSGKAAYFDDSKPHVTASGQLVHVTSTTRGGLNVGDTMYDAQYDKFYKVKRENGKKVLVPNPRLGYTIPTDGNWSKFQALRVNRIENTPAPADVTDQELLDGIEKAGWPKFDPSKGAEQFDYTPGALHEKLEDAKIEFTDPSVTSPAVQDALRKIVENKGDGYEASVDRFIAASNPQEDMPEGYGTLTDEDMQEMDASLSAVRKVNVYTDWDSDDNPVYEVNVSDYGTFLTGDSDAAEATTRAAAAGQWGEIESWDEHPETKLRMVARNLEHPEELEGRRKSNENELSTLNDKNDTLSYKRFKLNLDNAMIDVAQKTLLDEEAKKSGRDMLDTSVEPPF